MLPKKYTVSITPRLPPLGFCQALGKRNNQIPQGLMDAGSKLTLIPRDLADCLVHQLELVLVEVG